MKAGLLRTQFSYQNTVVREKMKEKTKESVSAVVPIMLIVLLLGFTIAPLHCWSRAGYYWHGVFFFRGRIVHDANG